MVISYNKLWKLLVDKKMSKADIMRQNHALNEARRKRFNTKG